MASDAVGLRAAELASYSAEKLVDLLHTTYRKDDSKAVVRVLTARERRAAEAEAELEAFHAANEKQTEELSKIHAKLKKLKASFLKIHAPLKKPERDAVPSKETPGDTALALLATLSIPVAQQSKQTVVEMVEANKGKVVDDSVGQGKSLKRKADEVETHDVSPVQISGELKEAIGVPPVYSPTPRSSSSSLIYEMTGPSSYSLLSQGIKVSGQVSEGVASVEGTGKTVTLKEPTPLEETGEGRNTPSEEATQNQISGGLTEEFSDSIAMIVEETQAELKESFSQIPAPLKETPDDTALALANLSIEVPQQSEQRVAEMVMVNEGGRAASDGSGGKSLKRKADAVETRGVSPLQISGARQGEEDIGAPPGYSPTPKFISSSLIYDKAGECSNSSLSQPINFSAQVTKGVASGEGSGKTVTPKGKEPMATDPLEETGEGRERNAPIEATQDQGVDQESVHLGESVSLITVPVQLVERFERATVSKRGRGRGRGPRGRTASEEKGKNMNVSGGSPSLGSGGRGRSYLQSCPHSLKRSSPLLGAARPRTVQKCPANLENAGNPSKNDGQANVNIASGHPILGTGGLLLPTIRICNVSGAEFRSMCGMGSSKVKENLGKCVLNKADSVPEMNNDAEGTSHEEGTEASAKSTDAGGASTEA